jgi:hypothetical protein
MQEVKQGLCEKHARIKNWKKGAANHEGPEG